MCDSSSAEHTGGASDCGGMKAGVASDYCDEGEGHDMDGEHMGLGEPKGASTLLKEYEELIPDLYLEIESLRAELDQERKHHAAQRLQILEEHTKLQAEVLAANETVQHLTCHNRQLQDQLDVVQKSLNLGAARETTDTQVKKNMSSTRSLDSLRTSLAKPLPWSGWVDDVQPESGVEKGGQLDDSSYAVGSLALSLSRSLSLSLAFSLWL